MPAPHRDADEQLQGVHVSQHQHSTVASSSTLIQGRGGGVDLSVTVHHNDYSPSASSTSTAATATHAVSLAIRPVDDCTTAVPTDSLEYANGLCTNEPFRGAYIPAAITHENVRYMVAQK